MKTERQPLKLMKDTTLTIRVNSLVKAAIVDQAEQQGESLTEFITKLALRELKADPRELTKLALS
jgi:predicted HicB family RNase H-like nuclease